MGPSWSQIGSFLDPVGIIGGSTLDPPWNLRVSLVDPARVPGGPFEAYLDPFWTPFWDHIGSFFDPSWILNGSTLDSFWNPFGSLGDPLGIIGDPNLDPTLKHPGSFKKGPLGLLLEPHWFFYRIHYGSGWVRIGPILEPSWFLCGPLWILGGLFGPAFDPFETHLTC